MTNLDKWKKEMIERIEKFDIDDAIYNILEEDDKCLKCIHYSTPKICWDCEEGIKAYLDMEIGD